MHYFVTGASGWIGSEVTRQLVKAGHKAIGLARSDRAAAVVEAAGGTPVRGSLTDLSILTSAAASSDGVIHCAYIMDFANFAASCAIDEQAINTLGFALAGTQKPLITTSGTFMLANGSGNYSVETDPIREIPGIPRKSEPATLAFAEQGVRAMVVRPSPIVHGEGDQMFMKIIIDIAREKGISAYIGDGASRWSSVHVRDTAKVYLAALEKGKAGGIYHAVADEGNPMKTIAEVVGKHLGVPVVAKTPGQEAVAVFGAFLAGPLETDNPTLSEITREELGIEFGEAGLLEDLEQGHYFRV